MCLRSRTIYFKLVEEADAEFILSLRSNDLLNQHLSKTSPSVLEQRKWIREYKERERNQDEFYFLIYRNEDNKPIGTVRLYDFKRDVNSFCWGSWLLSEDKTKYSAIESSFLVYDFAFDVLGFDKSHFDVRKENKKVISFHKKMGAKIKSENEIEFFFEMKKESVLESKQKLSRFL